MLIMTYFFDTCVLTSDCCCASFIRKHRLQFSCLLLDKYKYVRRSVQEHAEDTMSDVVVRKEIVAKVDLDLHSRLEELHQNNKELFLNSRFEQYRSDEISRKNENLLCEIALLQKLFDEQEIVDKKEQKALRTRNKTQVKRLKDEIYGLRLKLTTVEGQLSVALENESQMNRTVCEHEMTIKSDLRFKKIDILEKENFDLVQKLHFSQEITEEKRYNLRENKLHSARTIEQLELSVKQLKIEIEKLQREHNVKYEEWNVEKDLLERKHKQCWFAMEEEKLNSKLQVASVQKVKDVELLEWRGKCSRYKTRSSETGQRLNQSQEDVARLSKDLQGYVEQLNALKTKHRLEIEKLTTEKNKKLNVLRYSERKASTKVKKYEKKYLENQKQFHTLSKEQRVVCKNAEQLGIRIKDLLEENKRLSLLNEQNTNLSTKLEDQEVVFKRQEIEIQRLKHELWLELKKNTVVEGGEERNIPGDINVAVNAGKPKFEIM